VSSPTEILSVHVERIDSMAVVFVEGELDCWTAPVLIETCSRLVSSGVDDLGIDCAEVDFIDCAGVEALADVVHLIEAVDGTGFLVNVPPPMRWLLDLFTVDLTMLIVDTLVLSDSFLIGAPEETRLSLN
jgi:anti-anti-sigma factor